MYIFIKVFFKTNLFIWFSHFQTQQQSYFNLYSQCFTQILFKTTFFIGMERILQQST